MSPKSIIRPGDKEVNTLLTFFYVFVISISTKIANAQFDQYDFTSSNVLPSLFVVIGVLSVMFFMTLVLLIYARWCHGEPNIQNHDNDVHSHSNQGMFGGQTRFSGLNIEVIESLPFFRFSSLKGAKHGLQCSVCLTKFEELEILRLLPKFKHESHRVQKVCSKDLSLLVNSSSMRLIVDGECSVGETSSNFEVFVEREDINHRIVVSDVVFKNWWSDAQSSDLMFLNSEILGFMLSDRFLSSDRFVVKHDSTDFEGSFDQYSIVNIREEMERKIMFENKFGKIKKSSSRNNTEITALSRFKNLLNNKKLIDSYSDLSDENVGNDINRRRKWFHIAKKIVRWFANRKSNRFPQHQRQEKWQVGLV
ncbi:hypothetical protein RND81_06G160800 [Saponaria officinalis]|uniref:Uncharacterized protein n=1 Tax=Saponaria officinalis TaxID=3572 RepID=A0AAW1KC71_SAPOF